MKKIILFQIVFLFQFCVAQNEIISYVNETGKPVKEKKASYLIQKLRFSDTSWEINTYKIYGPMLTSIQTKDENGLVKNGRYISYNNRVKDTLGYYNNNLKDSLRKTFTNNEYNGVVTQTKYKNDQLITEKNSDEKSQLVHVEIESIFAGGYAGWNQYLAKNFHYPDKTINNEIQGRVIIDL
jgi:hypothetical protein